MTFVQAAFSVLVIVLSPRIEPPTLIIRADTRPPFLIAVGDEGRLESKPNVWNLGEQPAPFAWMTAPSLFSTESDTIPTLGAEPFQQVLERMSVADEVNQMSAGLPGVVVDSGRWRYQQEHSGNLYKRKTKLELPDPTEVWTRHAARDWKAQEKVQIPVPMPIPAVEQIFVYGQFDGSGDALNNQRTSLYGKTGIGVKWLFLAGSEVQLRYATLLTYADELSVGRFQERAQPAVELMARMPIIGPLEIEYSSSAIPAIARTDTDQLKQELRLAFPLHGDNELEFGARYRWEYAPVSTPWADRAQIFLGVKLRH